MTTTTLTDIELDSLLRVVVERVRADLAEPDFDDDNQLQREENIAMNDEIEDADDRCEECGSTEAGNCFYCKMD